MQRLLQETQYYATNAKQSSISIASMKIIRERSSSGLVNFVLIKTKLISNLKRFLKQNK